MSPKKKAWQDKQFPLSAKDKQLNQLGIMNQICNTIGIARGTSTDRVFQKRELLTIWAFIQQAAKTIEMQRRLLRKYEKALGFDFDVE